MSDSVLDRIRQNRHRTVVPARDDTLITQPPLQAQVADIHLEEVASDVSVASGESILETKGAIASNTLEQLRAELAKLPETRRHSAIVLEKQLDQELTRFCKDRGVTVEVFLEAAWIITMADPILLEPIMVEAKRRYDARKQAGRLRRLITMLGEK